MNRLVSATALLALLAPVAAYGADLYNPGASTKDAPIVTGVPAPIGNFGGAYIGAHLGYGWAGTRDALDITAYDLNGAITDHNVGVLGAPDVSGILGGVQGGYDVQKGSFVGGIVASFSGSAIGGDKGDSKSKQVFDGEGSLLGTVTESAKISQSLDWLGEVGARGGFAVDHFLVYGTGGFAFGGVTDKLSHKVSAVDASGVPVTDASVNYSESWKSEGVRTGYFVGGGVEYRAGNWGLDVGYQYVDLGSHGIGGTTYDHDVYPYVASGTLATNSIHSDFHIVKVGLNYHIN